MRIITGHRGTPHITSNDEQGRNQGIFGTGNYVLNVGQKLNATMTDATTVTLEDGEGIMQGVHFRIAPGTTEAISISPGTTGYNRIDLICARYTKDVSTGIEDVGLVVIEGTPNASTPSAPSHNTGDILGGDTLVDFPLWKVTLTGVSPALKRLSAVSSVGKAVLWTTGDPSTEPAPDRKSYSFDASKYSQIEVVYSVTTAAETLKTVQRHPVGGTSMAQVAFLITNSSNQTTMYNYITSADVSTSGATIMNGNLVTIASGSVSATAGNYFTVTKIYGIE